MKKTSKVFLNYGFIIVRSSVVKTNKQKQQNNKKKNTVQSSKYLNTAN